VAAQFADSEHGKAFAAGVKGAPNCLLCHDQRLTRETRQGDAASLKVAQERICLSCHLNDPDVRKRMAPGAGFIAAYEKSVHGQALLAGNAQAANCVDCHGSHEMRHGFDPKSRVSKEQIPTTCARCHADVAARYGESVHAAALRRGNSNAPICTDCHSEHNIMLHTDPRAPVAARNVSAQVCSPCHSSLKLSQKYGIASDRFRTFSDSYHGLALRGGAVQVANCASCHGAHDIKASADPSSTINKANLAATCGRCHPGANRRFAIGPIHVVTGEPRQPVIYWIARTYVLMIVLTVGGMFLHNLLDFLKRSRRRLRIRRGEIVEEEAGHALYVRMTLFERLQHAALMSSFVVLVVTGFMLRYPDAAWVHAIRKLSDHAFDLRSLVHRIAAVIMTAAGLVHLAYLGFTARGREFLRDVTPTRRDVADVFGVLAYNLGMTRRKPRFGRFSYVEKSEYWAVVWGTLVMAATGTIMWFENFFIGHLTKLGFDVARTVHFYEAVLATLAIIVWHLYSVIANPDVYPMNSAWLTGKLTESEMAEEHPLELAAIRRQAEEDAAASAADPGEVQSPATKPTGESAEGTK
jgi:formate dehydrogenase gamma subunit